jgi:hypothetical protein
MERSGSQCPKHGLSPRLSLIPFKRSFDMLATPKKIDNSKFQEEAVK